MAESFSSNWRKKAACVTCRRSKIRCEFSSPQSKTCKSCLRRGVECILASSSRLQTEDGSVKHPIVPRPKRKTQGTTTFAWLATRDAETVEELDEKVKQLRKVMREAQDQVNAIEASRGNGETDVPSIDANASAKSGTSLPATRTAGGLSHNGPVDWSPAVLQRPDCLNAAIEVGLVHYEEAQHHYKYFMEEMRLFVPVFIPHDRSFEDSLQVHPILTLAAIVCSRANSTTTGLEASSLDALIIFMERLISERIFTKESQAPAIINALMLMAVYLQPTPQPKIPNYVMMALTCAMSVDIGKESDIQALQQNSENEEVKERLRAYAAMFLASIGASAREATGALLSMMPRIRDVTMVLYSHGDPIDKFVSNCCKLHYVGTMGIKSMQAVRDRPLEEIQDALAKAKGALNDLADDTARVSLGFFGSEGIRKPFKSAENAFLIGISEIALNYTLFNQSEKVEPDSIRPIAYEITDYAQTMINQFLDVALIKPKMPQWFFFRPLQGITALLRLRMIFWSLGFEYNSEIETYYKRLKDAWKKARTTTSMNDKLMDALSLIDKWIGMKLQENTNDQNIIPTSGLLHSLLRDAVVSNTREEFHKAIESDIIKSVSNSAANSPEYNVLGPGNVQPPPSFPVADPIEPPQNFNSTQLSASDIFYQEPLFSTPIELLPENVDDPVWQHALENMDLETGAEHDDADELLKRLFSSY